MINDGSTEWVSELNVTESSWIHFKLHWIKVSGWTCDPDTEPEASPLALWFQETLGDQIWSWPFLSQSVRPHEFDCWCVLCTMHLEVCVHMYAYTFSVCVFPLRAIFWGSNLKPNLSQQVWQVMCLICFFLSFFFFIKSNFVAKMHTCAKMLHLSGCPAVSGAVARVFFNFLSGAGTVEEEVHRDACGGFTR